MGWVHPRVGLGSMTLWWVGKGKGKRSCNISPHASPLRELTVSHAIWDHTMLPATRQRWHLRPFPPAEAGTRFSDPVVMPVWVDLVGWLHTEMVYLSIRRSLIQVPNRARDLTSFMRRTPLTTAPCHHARVGFNDCNDDYLQDFTFYTRKIKLIEEI